MKFWKVFVLMMLAYVLLESTEPSTPQWGFMKQAGGASMDEYGRALAFDNLGNCYVTGGFSGSSKFGSTTLEGVDTYNLFVAKLDSLGNWLWANQAAGHGYSIAMDNSGNCYIAGSFWERSKIGTDELLSKGWEEILVAKMDPQGKWLWARRAGGSSDDVAFGIAVDNAGNCYVSGVFSRSSEFGPYTLDSGEDYAMNFISKLDTDGNWLWVKKAGSTRSDSRNAISLDSAGHLFFTGCMSGRNQFGSTVLQSKDGDDILVAKADFDGNWLWAKRAGGETFGESGYAIDTDSSGNCYITGNFRGTADFGSTTLSCVGDGDVFVASLDADGKWIMATKTGKNFVHNDPEGKSLIDLEGDDDYGYGIRVSNSGDIYVTGRITQYDGYDGHNYYPYDADLLVACVDTYGKWKWIKLTDDDHGSTGWGIALDKHDYCWITGEFWDEINLDSVRYLSWGGADIIVGKLNTGVDN